MSFRTLVGGIVAVLNKNNLKELAKNKIKSVRISEWDCDVFVKQMSVREQLDIEKLNKEQKDQGVLVFTMIQYCCVDEDEVSPLFENIDEISQLPANGVIQLFQECLAWNNMRHDELEQAAKN